MAFNAAQQDMIDYHKRIEIGQDLFRNKTNAELKICLDLNLHSLIKRELADRETLTYHRQQTQQWQNERAKRLRFQQLRG